MKRDLLQEYSQLVSGSSVWHFVKTGFTILVIMTKNTNLSLKTCNLKQFPSCTQMMQSCMGTTFSSSVLVWYILLFDKISTVLCATCFSLFCCTSSSTESFGKQWSLLFSYKKIFCHKNHETNNTVTLIIFLIRNQSYWKESAMLHVGYKHHF